MIYLALRSTFPRIFGNKRVNRMREYTAWLDFFNKNIVYKELLCKEDSSAQKKVPLS